jgi:hypothetical protein
MITTKDKNIIRKLAARWMEFASLEVMNERKHLWKAVHSLKMERPVILIETTTIDGFVSPDELLCEDPYLKAVERNMRDTLRHAEEVGDDIVIEPYFRIGWQMLLSSFGVDVEVQPAVNPLNDTNLGYTFNFPVKTTDDIKKLKKRTISVDRENTMRHKELLEDVMGDILPVRIGNYDPFLVDPGDEIWAGMFFFGLTWQVYRFIGNENLNYWLIDSPDFIHRLMNYMLEDRTAFFDYLEKENLLALNTDNQMAGPRSYGYVSDLPDPEDQGKVTLKDLWGWAESQEAVIISPTMYKEFVLPYLAHLGSKFGLLYYGCCEPVDDRLDLIIDAIPNLRSVSVSGWADFKKVGEMLGKKYVYSRKPTPALLSGANPDWSLAKDDMKKTADAAKDCNLEILIRDLYTINGDRPRLKKWVEITKSIFGF